MCIEGHQSQWRSQPLIGTMALGNLLVAASILFTGNTYTRIKEFCDLLSLPIVNKSTFMDMQRKYLFPVINHFYIEQRKQIISQLKSYPEINISGDGRCDSPGFSAKYFTYSFMDPKSNQIIDFILINVGTVANSVVMEKIGFVNLLQRMEKEHNLTIRSITTDRHRQIRCYLEKHRPDIVHQFDIWHVHKSIKKKIRPKLEKCEDLAKWAKSIYNHFWWCCRTCEGNESLLKEKWLSLLYHIRNKHRWNNDKKFKLLKHCEHGKLSTHQKDDIEWLKPDSPDFQALERVVHDKNSLKDFAYLTEF